MSRRKRKREAVQEFVLTLLEVGEQKNSSDIVLQYNQHKSWSTICKSTLGQILRSLVDEGILIRRQIWVKSHHPKTRGSWESIYKRLK